MHRNVSVSRNIHIENNNNYSQIDLTPLFLKWVKTIIDDSQYRYNLLYHDEKHISVI